LLKIGGKDAKTKDVFRMETADEDTNTNDDWQAKKQKMKKGIFVNSPNKSKFKNNLFREGSDVHTLSDDEHELKSIEDKKRREQIMEEVKQLETMVRKPEERYIYKLQFDATAALFYALGSSLTHFIMIVMMFLVRAPDRLVAVGMDLQFQKYLRDELPRKGHSIDQLSPAMLTLCQDAASEMQFNFLQLWTLHIVLLVTCFYKEIYMAKQSFSTRLMIGIQTLSLLFQVYVILSVIRSVIFLETRARQSGLGVITEL
jgi:hypothetical protein